MKPGTKRAWLAVATFWLTAVAIAAEDAPAPANRLPAPVLQALKRQGLPPEGLSVYVHEVGAETPLVAVAADTPRNPASVMKLVTTLAALEELGPAYTWKTEAYTTGTIRDGRLEGDLYLKGYGDPYLVIEHFWRLLRGLRNAGVREIAGSAESGCASVSVASRPSAARSVTTTRRASIDTFQSS